MIFPESAIAHSYLDGKQGIEIGASAHNPFNIPGCIYVDYSLAMDTEFKLEEIKLCGHALQPQLQAYAWDLPFKDETLEYVLSSHVIEHCWDVLKTLREWLRVLRPGGIIFMIVPHKDRTFDKDRERTPYAELTARFLRQNPLGEAVIQPEFDDQQHWSVWVTEDWDEICKDSGLIFNIWDKDDKVGNGFMVMMQKPG